ncbi:MAG TPA: hypothetical protein VEG64_16955 [Candidatus Sulfotelmatobacter sp.]|nr:hypothetical protein [Candidatus Sulfotelmatobacter sp.]
MRRVRMRKLIKRAFNDTAESLPRELKTMPLGRWSEGVFRYFFCRFLSKANASIVQRLECDHIDLVLRGKHEIAFVEFKFYWRPPRFNPETDQPCGFKGGPGKKNLSEFRKCIKKLGSRRSDPNLSKYVVLLFADPLHTPRQKNSFARSYGDYKHTSRGTTVQSLSQKSFHADEHAITCRLFEISRAAGAQKQRTRSTQI